MKYKFCSEKHNKGSCPAYGKICSSFGNKGHFAKCCTKKKGIHSLNEEYSDNTTQDNFLSYCEDLFMGTVNAENSNQINNSDVNFENTDNRNSFKAGSH